MAVPNNVLDRDVLRAVIATSATNTTIVAAAAGKKILVLSYAIVASGGANNFKWQSGAGGTDLTGVMNLAANGQFITPFNPGGTLECAVNTLLNLNLSAATAVGGSITYTLID